nr:ATP-dependent DNA helicase PIF1-like [Tanacetum cinerariifolium]
WILDIGNGKVGGANDGVSTIVFPDNMLIPETDDDVGDEKDYESLDIVCLADDDSNFDDSIYTTEFLNGIKMSGIPHHSIKLKIGTPIMLMRNIDQRSGLCNRTKLQVLRMGENIIEAKIITGTSAVDRTYPRAVRDRVDQLCVKKFFDFFLDDVMNLRIDHPLTLHLCAWTHEEEITLCKGWVDVPENSSLGNTRNDAVFWCEVLQYMKRKTKQYGRRTLQESGASDKDYYARALVGYEAETGTTFKLQERRTLSLFRDPKEGRWNVVNERDKAKEAAKKKGSRASGSSSMNDEAFARLMVTKMANQKKEEHLAFLEIQRRGGGMS